MKVIIPEHIKKIVDRIVAEYEHIYETESAKERSNEKVYIRIETADKTYVNAECYLYFAQSAKRFREELDKQETELFQEDDEHILRRKIVSYIEDYFCDLPADSCDRVYNREVFCEEQLENALKKKRFKKGVKKEAISMLDFIQKRQTWSWGQLDANIYRCFFKYVETEQEFENLFTQKEYIELTPGDINPFKEIRVAYVQKHERDIYEEKGILSEFEKLLYKSYRDSFSSDLKTFDMWNDIKETGIYYVFIPQIKKSK